jgi:hypothetical protein
VKIKQQQKNIEFAAMGKADGRKFGSRSWQTKPEVHK